MKLGDWVTWKNGTGAGQVTSLRKLGEQVVVDVVITKHHEKLSIASNLYLTYPIEVLTVIPESVAKIINS